MVDVDAVFRDVVVHDLTETARHGELGPSEWVRLLSVCSAARLVGCLASAAASGVLDVTPAQADELAAENEAHERHVAAVVAQAEEASAILGRLGIDHRFYKGVATRELLYPPGVRHFADADVLVARDDFSRAYEALRTAGFELLAPEQPDPRRISQLGVNLVRGGVGLDLHHALVRPPMRERIGGAPMRTAAAPGLLPLLPVVACGVVSALELAIHDREPKPNAVRDCLRALRANSAAVRSTAAAWGVLGFVALGVTRASRAAGIEDPAWAWASQVTVGRRERWLYWAFHRHRAPEIHAATFASLPPRRWAGYLSEVASARRGRRSGGRYVRGYPR